MSRGIGKLQRAILAELEKRTSWVTAVDIAESIDGHPVAVRRALHSLWRRDLVVLAHLSSLWFSNLPRGESLVAWLPGRHETPNSGNALGLNPERCVSNQLYENATLRAKQARLLGESDEYVAKVGDPNFGWHRAPRTQHSDPVSVASVAHGTKTQHIESLNVASVHNCSDTQHLDEAGE